MTTSEKRAPQSLHEWMDRTGTSSRKLIALVKEQTGRDISETMMSFLLRGSRRCSKENAEALHAVTGISVQRLRRWKKSESDKQCGRRPSHAA